jgi:hypothetical protein
MYAMSQSESKTKYHSFEEFKHAFYPETSKAEESKERDSYARDMAKYAVERHFPPGDQKGRND